MSTTPMHDELDLGKALVGFEPVPERLERLVTRWTKYNKASDEGCVARLTEETGAVAIKSPVDGRIFVVLRRLEERRAVTDPDTGKPVTRTDGSQAEYLTYGILGWKPCPDLMEALATLEDIRAGVRLQEARNTDGHGEPQVDDDEVAAYLES